MGDVQGYILLFLICIIPTLVLGTMFKNRKISRLPPSPPAFPIIGHLHLLDRIPHQTIHKLSTRYGPLIHLYLGSIPCVVSSSPETAKEFLKTHEASFSNRPQNFAIDYLSYGSQDFTFTPYGPYWKFMKKLCVSQLLGGRTMELLLPVRESEIKHSIQLLSQKATSGEAVDMGAELVRLASNAVSRMLMSKRCSQNDGEAGDIRKLTREIAELVGKFNLSDFIWFCKNLDLQRLNKRIRDVRVKFDEIMDRIIEEHQVARENYKQSKKGFNDLLDILLDISEDESSDIKLTREKINAFIANIFVAGTDASASTAEWALAELINHPDIMQKAVQEIDSVVGKSRLVNESDIPNLPYLQAIVKETLRLHPSIPLISRESCEDCIIGDYHIPAKTRLFVNVWAIGRDPKYWEDPLEFRPERFLFQEESGKLGQLDVRGQHFHLLPLGSGRRGCPGTSLGLQLVQSSLAAIIQCFELKLSCAQGVGKGDMEEGRGITLPRAHPLVCVPVARLNPFPSM